MTADRPATEPRPADKLRWALTITAREQDTGDLWMHRDDADEAVQWLDAALAEAAQGAAPLDELAKIAAEILRFTGGCEKPHRNGEANPHVHHEVTHRWGQRLAAIARTSLSRRAAPRAEGLDVERLAAALRTDPGIDAIFEDVDAAAADIAYRYADTFRRRPSDERVPESEEPR